MICGQRNLQPAFGVPWSTHSHRPTGPGLGAGAEFQAWGGSRASDLLKQGGVRLALLVQQLNEACWCSARPGLLGQEPVCLRRREGHKWQPGQMLDRPLGKWEASRVSLWWGEAGKGPHISVAGDKEETRTKIPIPNEPARHNSNSSMCPINKTNIWRRHAL
jgi:hypothetical protein